MRSLCAFAMAAAFAPAAFGADSLTFRARPMQAGEAHRVITGGFFDFSLTVAADGQTLGSQAVKTRVAETYGVEVLEADAAGPTLVRARYFQAEAHVAAGGEPERKEVEPVAGKTFLVSATRVTDEKGGPVDPGAAEQVIQDFARLGRADPFCRLLDGRAVALGETVEVDPAAAGLFLGISAEDEEVQRLSLTLREVVSRQGTAAAVFELQVRSLSRRMEGALITSQAAGLATVSADCRLLSLEMAGPLTIAGSSQEEGKTIDVRGAGRVKMVVRLEYER